MSRSKCYKELCRIDTYEGRFDYLSLGGVVGTSTFGFDRYMNQLFYRSFEWRRVRELVIIRDGGCDLGMPDYPIHTELLVHHMNPVTPDEIERGHGCITDPEFLITTCLKTHNAIHYGDFNLLPQPYEERRAGDTNLW